MFSTSSGAVYPTARSVREPPRTHFTQSLRDRPLTLLTPVTNGVLSQVYHFDSKAAVEDHIRSLGIPATFFMAGFYMANLPGMSLREMQEGKWGLALPLPEDSPIPLFAAEHDTGKFVKAIFLKKDQTLGKRIYGATAYYTPKQIIDEFKEVFPEAGKDAGFSRLPDEVFKGIMASTGAPEPVQEEMLQNMRLMPEFGYYGGDKLEPSLSVSFFLKKEIYPYPPEIKPRSNLLT